MENREMIVERLRAACPGAEIMLDEPIPEPEPTPEPPAPVPPQPIPKLGFEDSNLYLAVACMVLASVACGTLIVIRAKRRKSKRDDS